MYCIHVRYMYALERLLPSFLHLLASIRLFKLCVCLLRSLFFFSFYNRT